jgi:hypothetical protein
MENDDRDDAPLVLQAEPRLPMVPTPDTLIRVFRVLRERIPGFTQLSVEEERSMIRASHLDPEFIADGMLAADAWGQAQFIAKMSVEEMRELDAAIRHWDDLEKELLVTARGIAGANRTRRYRLGKAILQLYFTLGIAVKDPRNSDLLPYYERMKRSYMKNRKKRGTKTKTAEPDAPGS